MFNNLAKKKTQTNELASWLGIQLVINSKIWLLTTHNGFYELSSHFTCVFHMALNDCNCVLFTYLCIIFFPTHSTEL